MPINTIGRTQADAGGFIPQYWAQKALDVLRGRIVAAKLVARDTDFQPGWLGKTLNIPYPGTFTAQDKTEGNPVTVQQTTGAATIAVTLSKHKYVDFTIEDWAQAQANSNLMMRYLQPACVALAEALEGDLLANIATFSKSVGTPGVDVTATSLRAARKALSDGKNPMDDRHMVISTKDEQAMLADPTLQTFFAFADNQAVTQGNMGMLYGLDVRTSQLTPIGAFLDLSAATAGNFTLSFAGQTTGNIAWNANAAAIQTAVQALTSVTGTANVVLVPGTTNKFFIYFSGTLSGTGQGSNTTSITGTFTGITGTASIKDSPLNFAFHRNAILLASRPFADPPAGAAVHVSSVVDDVSGLTMRMQYQYDMNYRGVHVGFDILYGFVKLRDVAGVIVNA